MFAFGVANNAPAVVIQELLKKKVVATMKEISILPSNTKIPKKIPEYKVLLVLNVGDLVANRIALESKIFKDIKVILFADAMKISDFVGVTPLDFEPSAEHPGFGFKLLPLNLSTVKRTSLIHSKIERKHGKYLENLVCHVRSGSLLNPLMTFLYTLPSTVQTRVKVAVVKWIYLSKTEKDLEKILSELPDILLTTRVVDKLKSILLTEIGKNYQDAFAEYRKALKAGSLPKVPALVKKYGVSDYEMRYIMSIIKDNDESAKLYTDSFDKARNRKQK